MKLPKIPSREMVKFLSAPWLTVQSHLCTVYCKEAHLACFLGIMTVNDNTYTETRLTFDLAEAIPSTSLDSHQPLPPWKERLHPSRWLRRRSTAVTAFSVIRCRKDWKELLVNTSCAARQQLANLAHPKAGGLLVVSCIFKTHKCRYLNLE